MDRNWAGLIALVLAAAIAVSLCAAIIIVSVKPEPLDQPFGAVITTLAGAAVGAVATYLGVARSPSASSYAPSDGTSEPDAPDEEPADESGEEPPAVS